MALYEKVRHDLYAGRDPVAHFADLPLEDLCDMFLAAKQKSVDSGELLASSCKEYRRSCARLLDALGKHLDVLQLRVGDFVNLREKLAEVTESPISLKNDLTRLKVLFRWAYESGTLDKPLPYATALKPPPVKLLRQAKARTRKKLFSQQEVLQLVASATGFLRPAIYLGINCGLGNRDVCELCWSFISDDGWLEYPRPKTSVRRRAKLWAETMTALSKWRAESPASDFVVCGERGQQLGSSGENTPIAHLMRDAMNAAKIDVGAKGEPVSTGRGFYALRHTYRTVADSQGDQPAILMTMGHADNTISGGYRQALDDSRLSMVSDHVRNWLLSGSAE